MAFENKGRNYSTNELKDFNKLSIINYQLSFCDNLSVRYDKRDEI